MLLLWTEMVEFGSPPWPSLMRMASGTPPPPCRRLLVMLSPLSPPKMRMPPVGAPGPKPVEPVMVLKVTDELVTPSRKRARALPVETVPSLVSPYTPTWVKSRMMLFRTVSPETLVVEALLPPVLTLEELLTPAAA
jgi:hypothetical protein